MTSSHDQLHFKPPFRLQLRFVSSSHPPFNIRNSAIFRLHLELHFERHFELRFEPHLELHYPQQLLSSSTAAPRTSRSLWFHRPSTARIRLPRSGCSIYSLASKFLDTPSETAHLMRKSRRSTLVPLSEEKQQAIPPSNHPTQADSPLHPTSPQPALRPAHTPPSKQT